jgi:hypothetical protein
MGPDPDLPSRQLVYVGEGDQVKTRLIVHDADEAKEFFTRAVLVVSKDENLTKVDGRYLESRLIAAIRRAGRAKLVNGTEPPFKGLPVPKIADMERVLDEVEVLLPVLGFDVLTPASQEASAAPSEGTKGAEAAAGSPVFIADIRNAQASSSSSQAPLRCGARHRVSRGVLPTSANFLSKPAYWRPMPTGSPSGASAAMAERADNGKQTWRVEGEGRSYARLVSESDQRGGR